MSHTALQVRCIQIAIDNPAAKGEMRVFNQFTEMWRWVGMWGVLCVLVLRVGMGAVGWWFAGPARWHLAWFVAAGRAWGRSHGCSMLAVVITRWLRCPP